MSQQDSVEQRLARAGHLNGVVPASCGYGALFIGDVSALCAREDHLRFGITAAVTCLVPSELPRSVPSTITEQFIIPLEDEEDSPIADYFEEMFDFIQDASQRGNVLIHCKYGISRSATLTIAYLMRRLGWAVSKAYFYLKGVRQVICPNMSFCRQLIEYQKTLEVSQDWDIVEGRLLYQPSLKEVKASQASTLDCSNSINTTIELMAPSGYPSRSYIL